MTTRELKITKGILDFLHGLDGGQATETQIHQGIIATWSPAEAKPSAGELAAALNNCDAEKWIVGVPSRFNARVMKWCIADEGELARQQMN